MKRKKDVRVIKSMAYLQDALMELMKRKRFTDIKIKEITDAALVSRQTFYAHFKNKDALYAQCLKIVFDQINEQIIQEMYVSDELTDEETLQGIIKVFKEHGDSLRVLISVENKDLLIDSMKKPTELILKTFKMDRTLSTLNVLQKKLFLDYVTGGFYMLLRDGLLDVEVMTSEEWSNHLMFMFKMYTSYHG